MTEYTKRELRVTITIAKIVRSPHMYILPQFLEIETKKLLKIKLNKIITDITDDFIENLFVVNPDNKYQNIMLNLDKNIRLVRKLN